MAGSRWIRTWSGARSDPIPDQGKCALPRERWWSPSLGNRNDADPDSQVEWCRSTGLAHRWARTHRRSPNQGKQVAQTAAVELEGRQRRNTLHPGSLINQSAQPYAVKESQPPVAAATLIPTALVSDS